MIRVQHHLLHNMCFLPVFVRSCLDCDLVVIACVLGILPAICLVRCMRHFDGPDVFRRCCANLLRGRSPTVVFPHLVSLNSHFAGVSRQSEEKAFMLGGLFDMVIARRASSSSGVGVNHGISSCSWSIPLAIEYSSCSFSQVGVMSSVFANRSQIVATTHRMSSGFSCCVSKASTDDARGGSPISLNVHRSSSLRGILRIARLPHHKGECS